MLIFSENVTPVTHGTDPINDDALIRSGARPDIQSERKP
jgi:hypothetical protein